MQDLDIFGFLTEAKTWGVDHPVVRGEPSRGANGIPPHVNVVGTNVLQVTISLGIQLFERKIGFPFG